MPFVAGLVLFSGYTLAWWGWEAMTDHVNPGAKGKIHWPSIKDLLSPGRISQAIPPKATNADTGVQAGGTSASPLAGTNSQIASQGGQNPNAPVGSQPIPPNDTYLNPIMPA